MLPAALRHRTASLIAVLAIVLAPFALAPAAQAAVVKPLDIVKVHFNPAGGDRPGGYSREYIQLRNTGTKTLNLSGYVIRDSGPQSFRFPSGFKLAKGKTVTIRSGKGRSTATTLYWGKKSYIWNNTGDIARLYSSSGRQLERCDFSHRVKSLGTTKTC